MPDNLLNLANSIIPRSTFDFRKYTGSATNSIGIRGPTYASDVAVSGIVQAVDNAAYQALKLEFGKNYIQVWGEVEMLGLDKQEGADQIIYNNRTYNVEKSTDWMVYNSWTSVIAVEDKSA
jgi:hypothetical protein